uniref:Protein KRI1 homolog n=1 Tax=Anopheles farauti TaxID=69004 RepID=A0A182QY25_9DIPT
MSRKINLFNESDQEDTEEVEFRTNRDYAKHYDEFRKKEILGQLKNLKEEVGSESDSSDDETTDDEIVDPEFDKEFFRTLAFLKRKDKNKYTEKPTFFENVKPIEEVALTKRHHKEKPMTVKDYERKVMLERGGVFEDEEEDGSHGVQRAESPTAVEEERKIKDEIKQALSKLGDDDSDEDDAKPAKGGGLLKERVKSAAEAEKEQSDYIQWLADKKALEPPSEEVKVLEPLKNFWSSEKLSKEDAFLKDYILNKRFVQASGEVPTYDEIVATSEDEEELEKQEEYERKYNFRFEEPDTDFIKQYPRSVDDSVRVEHNKRREQRQALKERKQREKEQQRRELEELKAVKLREIREKIQRLKEIAATDNLAMNEDDLESEFDPDEHDRRMQRMFNDEYYGVDEGDQKPEFPELDEELGIENYDVERINDETVDDVPHCEDDDFVMDCDYDPTTKSAKETHQQELLEATRAGKKKGRRQSKFREMLKAEKPLFDPEDEKTYGEYIDEYYKLDYEDMIGDIPCRFRYVETVPNDFGLTIEEILKANTRDLNKWASVKKTVQLRPKHVEQNEVAMYQRRAANEAMKRKLLPSLFVEEDADEEVDEDIRQQKEKLATVASKSVPTENQVDNIKKSKKNSGFKEEPVIEGVEEHGKATKQATDGETTKKKKKKIKKEVSDGVATQPDSNDAPATSSNVTSNNKNHAKKLDRQTTGTHRDAKHPPKRKWDQSIENGQRHTRMGPQNGRGGFKGRQNGDTGAQNRGRANKVESAADQRLRAFGLNPTKFHNKQVYGNQGKGKFQQNRTDAAPANKRIKFE